MVTTFLAALVLPILLQYKFMLELCDEKPGTNRVDK